MSRKKAQLERDELLKTVTKADLMLMILQMQQTQETTSALILSAVGNDNFEPQMAMETINRLVRLDREAALRLLTGELDEGELARLAEVKVGILSGDSNQNDDFTEGTDEEVETVEVDDPIEALRLSLQGKFVTPKSRTTGSVKKISDLIPPKVESIETVPTLENMKRGARRLGLSTGALARLQKKLKDYRESLESYGTNNRQTLGKRKDLWEAMLEIVPTEQFGELLHLWPINRHDRKLVFDLIRKTVVQPDFGSRRFNAKSKAATASDEDSSIPDALKGEDD